MSVARGGIDRHRHPGIQRLFYLGNSLLEPMAIVVVNFLVPGIAAPGETVDQIAEEGNCKSVNVSSGR